jgi:hypothetical protein
MTSLFVRTLVAAATPVAILSAGTAAAPPAPPATPAADADPAQLPVIAGAVAPSLVRVEYELGYDKGQSPGGDDPWLPWSGGASAARGAEWESFDLLIREERPAERAGWLIAPTLVASTDLRLHDRFIASIAVRHGAESIPAKPAAYALADDLVYLELERPFRAARPLAFDRGASAPYHLVSAGRTDGSWRMTVQPIGAAVIVTEDGRRFTPAGAGLVVDGAGSAVGLTTSGELTVDGAWKGSPVERGMMTHAEMIETMRRIEERADEVLPRVRLGFRSPRSDEAPGPGSLHFMPGGEDAAATEWYGTAVVLDPRNVLVLANLPPRRTARLERIELSWPDGRTMSASFAGTVRDHGGFLAAAERRMQVAPLAAQPLAALRHRLLIQAEVTVHGENRTVYFTRQRVDRFRTSWNGRVYPALDAQGSGGMYATDEGAAAMNFLFTLDGALVAVPLERREKVTIAREWGGAGPLMVPTEQLAPIAGDATPHVDPDNRPLTEEEEGRLAWLGVELQPMTPDLARMNGISHLTNGGTTGALVTYVYAGSPAARAGIALGDVLLRLHVKGQPKPLEVSIEESSFGGEFPWEYFDQVPPEFFSQLPAPWGSVDNRLNRALTELGFGTPFAAAIFRAGETQRLDCFVTEGPRHFESAPRFKSEDVGLTVRDLTYEVRRYFQIEEGAPGVIISKVEPGEKAAIAGLRPFELILSINDAPVRTSEEFRSAVAAAGPLRLFVKRMTDGRTVTLTSEGE